MSEVYMKDLPQIDTITDTTAIITENTEKTGYSEMSDVKEYMNGSEALNTTAQTTNGAINELASKLQFIEQDISKNNNNIVYGCYSTGWYAFHGNIDGNPCNGYNGILLTFKLSFAIMKIAICINGWTYVMSNNTDGTVNSPWHRIDQ